MISVSKPFHTPPPSLISDVTKLKINHAINEKTAHRFSEKIYRNECLPMLSTLYSNKCAYCEVKPENGNVRVQVDHFRPKKKILNSNHDGYYWLGYEWSNLLPSCPSCNRNKSSHFPLEKEENRVYLPETYDETYFNVQSPLLINEGALLLNPELDKVEEYFIFTPKGEIKALDDNPKAIATISTMGLNSSNLIRLRKKIVDDYVKDFQLHIKQFLDNSYKDDILNAHLNKMFYQIADCRPHRSFSRYRYFMFHKFEIFFVRQMPTTQSQDILLQYFKQFIPA